MESFVTPITEVTSYRWDEKAAELWDRVVERFQAISELPMEGSLFPIMIAIGIFLFLVLGIYLTGWTHVAAGP